MKLRVLLVDHDSVFRESLRSRLVEYPSIKTVDAVGDGIEGLTRALQEKPDIVCWDIGLSGLSAIEATRHLHNTLPQTKVIGLLERVDPSDLVAMLEAGAAGCVTRSEGWRGLLRAILGVGRYGRTYLCPEVACQVLAARCETRSVVLSESEARPSGE